MAHSHIWARSHRVWAHGAHDASSELQCGEPNGSPDVDLSSTLWPQMRPMQLTCNRQSAVSTISQALRMHLFLVAVLSTLGPRLASTNRVHTHTSMFKVADRLWGWVLSDWHC